MFCVFLMCSFLPTILFYIFSFYVIIFFFLNNDTYFFNLYFYDQSLDFESYQEYLFHFRGDAFVFCCALSKGLSFHVVLVHLSSCVVFVDVLLLLVEPGHPVLACPCPVWIAVYCLSTGSRIFILVLCFLSGGV